jgi:hypothetical protein
MIKEGEGEQFRCTACNEIYRLPSLPPEGGVPWTDLFALA